MRRVIFAVALGVGLAAFVAPRSAHAFVDERVDVHVPFAFHVDGVQLPAGEYVIQQEDVNEPQVVILRSQKTDKGVLMLTQNAHPARGVRASELVFDRYGKSRFLHAIWLTDDDGAVFSVSPAESHAARVAKRQPSAAMASTRMSR